MLNAKNKHEFDDRIKFQPKGHKYWIDGDDTDVVSATTYIKSFFSEFDTDKIVTGILKKHEYTNDPDYKYYKMDPEIIKNIWEKNRNESSGKGTDLHKDIEDFYNNICPENDSVEFQYFLNFYNDHNEKYEIYRTEFLVFSEELKITGSIDALFQNVDDGTFAIFDWKRSKEINMESYNNKKGKYPFDHVLDCNYYHYSLQLNLYRIILEKFYNIPIKELFLVILHPNQSNYSKMNVKIMEDEAELLLLYRMKELIDKGYDTERFNSLDFSENNKLKIEKINEMNKTSTETMTDNYYDNNIEDEVIVSLLNKPANKLKNIETNIEKNIEKNISQPKKNNNKSFIEAINGLKFVKHKDPEKLSEKQQFAFDLINKGENILMTAPAGYGKSFVIEKVASKYSSFKIGITSTTGTSAILIGGSTLHSFLGIGLGTADVSQIYLNIKKNSYIHKRWKELDILIIDEVSMLSPLLFDKIEQLARVIRKNENPFGGIQLILSADFFQLPVVGDSNNFCFDAKSWDSCIPKSNIIVFDQNFRQDNIVFQKILTEIRYGKVSDESMEILRTRENVKLVNEHGIMPTKIFSLNRDVDNENEKELNNLVVKNPDLEFYEYELTYDILKKSMKNFNFEDRIKKTCNVPFTLQLCKGAQVMLMFNLDLDLKLCNGSRGVVVGFDGEIPIVKFLNGVTMAIIHKTWTIEENGEPIFMFTQIPLKVAFAVSAHKVQGITIDYSEVDLVNIFEFGQAYVALSRCRTLEGLSIINLNKECFKAHPRVVDFYNSL
jgi:ATP-dependent DNA helicase PIF1